MDAPFLYAGELSALASSMLWAIGGVIIVGVPKGVTAMAVNVGKNLVAIALFALLLLFATGSPLPGSVPLDTLALLVASGIAGFACCDTLLLRSFLVIGPRRANLCMASCPVIVALLALLPPFSESPAPLVWIGMAVCLTGVVLAVLERSGSGIDRADFKRGMRDALAASFFQACTLLLWRLAAMKGEVGVTEGALIRFLAGTCVLLIVGLIARRTHAWAAQLRGGGAWRRVALGAFVGGFLGIWMNQAGQAWSEHAGVAATLNAMAPVFLIPLSAAFLAERHDWRAWVSTALAVGGIALMTLV